MSQADVAGLAGFFFAKIGDFQNICNILFNQKWLKTCKDNNDNDNNLLSNADYLYTLKKRYQISAGRHRFKEGPNSMSMNSLQTVLKFKFRDDIFKAMNPYIRNRIAFGEDLTNEIFDSLKIHMPNFAYSLIVIIS